MNKYFVFSEAIRDGAKLRPQITGRPFKGGGSCSIGAGAEAMGVAYFEAPDMFDMTPFEPLQAQIMDAFPYLETARVDCPAECKERDATTLGELIWHLNDSHDWTREAVADWLNAEEERLGFITISVDETEALKPKMIAEPNTLKATAHLALVNLNDRD